MMIIKTLLGIFVIILLLGMGALIKLALDSRDISKDLGLQNGRLKPCPESPNCVSSDVPESDLHYIAPLASSSPETWTSLQATIDSMDGVELLEASDNYLCYTFRTPLLGFSDDVEFHYRPDREVIAVRSASRVGYGDLNTNRKRIERIRSALSQTL